MTNATALSQKVLFGLPINGLDHFEAARAAQDWNGFPVPLVAHDYALQIAEAVGDIVPEPYEGERPYDGLCWQIICADCGTAHSAEHECEPLSTWTGTTKSCPECGGTMSKETGGTISEPVMQNGGAIARVARLGTFYACNSCEHCEEVGRG